MYIGQVLEKLFRLSAVRAKSFRLFIAKLLFTQSVEEMKPYNKRLVSNTNI